MTAILKSFHRFEYKFDKQAERFTFHHPFLSYFIMFIGMPIFILLSVAACTALIALPMALIFGWL